MSIAKVNRTAGIAILAMVCGFGCASKGNSNPGGGSGGAAPASGGASVSPGSGGGSVGSGGQTAATGGAAVTGGAGGTGGSSATGGTASGDVDAGAGGTVATDAGAMDAAPPPPFTASFHIGADITWVQHDEFYGATYLDSDGTPKEILALLKGHGFNSIRLRTFVDPRAADGYDKVDGFGDMAHTVTMGQRIKQAGMGFYIAVHYSDNWADPGKQCIPVAWQGLTSVSALATAVHDYTVNLVTALKNAGARPDLVQVGNEITSGMLIHICDANGTPTSTNAVNGSISNWGNLGMLLRAGVAGVKDVDPTIKTVLHLDRARDLNASAAFITNARTQTVPFDIFAESTYVYWHGQPSGWQSTFSSLQTMFPTLSFAIPEYGNETATSPALTTTIRFVNDLMFNMPNNRGVGAWFYEPEHPFQAGPMAGVSLGIGLFDGVHGDGGVETGDSWPTFPALPAAMTMYDQMRTAYAGRL